MQSKGAGIMVVIPALNEEQTIAGVIAGIRQHLPQADIVVVNDGSSDRTAELAQAEGTEVLNLIENLGIGGAMQCGFKLACQLGYQVVIQMDGDGQHPAEYLPRLLAPLQQGRCQMVVGSRYLEGSTPGEDWRRDLAKWIIARVMSRVLKISLTDCTSGFRAMTREVFCFFASNYPCDYPEPESIMMLHVLGFDIEEVPVVMRPRRHGNSSISLLKGLHYVANVILSLVMIRVRQLISRIGKPC